MAAFLPSGVLPEARAADCCAHQWDCGTITTAPDCLNTGVKIYACKICRATKAETIAPLGHSYGKWEKWNADWHKRVCTRDPSHTQAAYHVWSESAVTTTATCTTAGVKTIVCSICGETKTEAVASLGHCFGPWTRICDYYHQRVCARDASHKEKAPHTWDCGRVTPSADCVTPGCITYTCTGCGATKTEKVPATGHNYGCWKKLNDECHQRVCANNPNHTETAKHTWDNGTVTQAASCAAGGITTYTCTGCGATRTCASAALGHAYGNWQFLNASFHRRVCSRDASHKIDAYHTWDCGKLVRQPGCTEPGAKLYTCTVCGGTKTEDVLPAGHSYGPWQKVNATQHQRVCTRDASHIQTTYHVWGKGTVTKEPTCNVPGVKTFTCAFCGATKTEPICCPVQEPVTQPEPCTEPVVRPDPTPACQTLVLSAASVSARPGDTVTVPVSICQAAPVSYLRLNVQYDASALQLVKAERGELFDNYEQGTAFVFDSVDNLNRTGVILTLTFKVCGNASGSIAVTLSGDAFTKNETPVAVTAKPCAVTIGGGSLLGDVNGDNTVDGRDLVRLRKYLANQNEATGLSTVTITSCSDVTGDGKVDGRDLIRLRKYLIALNEATGISSVVLG